MRILVSLGTRAVIDGPDSDSVLKLKSVTYLGVTSHTYGAFDVGP